jgi:DNA repair exonuclease SbcCD nuclease subunit
MMSTLRTLHAKLPFDVLEGNHDQDQSGDGTSTVGAFDGIVRAHTQTSMTTVAGIKFGWLPYTDDPEIVKRTTAKLAKMGAQVLMAHLGIGDPKFSDCMPVDYETPGRINVSDLHPELFQQVFLGHYHTSQDLAPNVRYIGSPLQLSFKEARISKGFWTWDPSTNEATFIENTISPRYHIVDSQKPDEAPNKTEVRDDDFLWYRAQSKDEAQELRKQLGDRRVPPRIDIAPSKSALARLSKDATTDAKKLAEYVRIEVPGMTDEWYDAMVKSGATLIEEVGDGQRST